MVFSWFSFSILATILLGLSMVCYKLPATKNYSRFATTFWALIISASLAIVFFHNSFSQTTLSMVLVAALWGITFASIMLLQMYALGHVDTNVLFPVTTTASLILTVLAGLLFFGEHVSLLQGLGIVLAIVTIFCFLYKRGQVGYSSLLLSVGAGIIFISAFNKVLQKIVADSFNIHAFQIYQYSFATLFSLGILLFSHRKDWKTHLFSGAWRAGALIGTFGFFGGYSLYTALTKGPFSLITSIHSLYIFVTALAAYFLFKEQLTKKKIFLLLLAIAAVILIRIG